jgi:hypothetical protein
MTANFTAKLFINDEPHDAHSGNDFQKLMVTLLNQIELCNTSTRGIIINNSNGQIIHRCRKTYIE